MARVDKATLDRYLQVVKANTGNHTLEFRSATGGKLAVVDRHGYLRSPYLSKSNMMLWLEGAVWAADECGRNR